MTQNLVLKQQAVSEKLQFASGDVFRRSLYSSKGLSMSQITTVLILAKSSHFLVRIIPAVRTPSSHFTGSPFRSLQFANYQTPEHSVNYTDPIVLKNWSGVDEVSTWYGETVFCSKMSLWGTKV